MLVARQGGKASAQGGSESATGLLACGGAQGELAGGALCAVGASALLRECGLRRAVLSHSSCLRDSRTHVFHERARQSEARSCSGTRSKLL